MTIKQLTAFALALSLSMLAAQAQAGDVFVVAHSSLNLAEEDLKDVFVGDKQIAGGIKLVPMDNASVQKDFLEKVLKIDAAKYSNVWTKKGFRDGLSPPAIKSSDAEILSAVKSTPGAVGYVSRASADVKVIKKF